jgi:hypothetical protein
VSKWRDLLEQRILRIEGTQREKTGEQQGQAAVWAIVTSSIALMLALGTFIVTGLHMWTK